ncbi:putative serine/threonine-protein kinase [Tetrabaena socialis]|uniref:Putative serine/threonine-protein kinase n=1 Tax=Tetrabaena socialis TaxID=47790 RepID=A0A2J8AD09_9CHLO|nr:putative serine/threonine-protein kinase [Tetrabaena socialis]|eukprot:PNH10401.1 putative serine/threonine-protein kinase [Tetrabaena socialis]
MADIALSEDDFNGQPTIQRSRNITVAGGIPAPALPLLDLAYIKNKVQLLEGAMLCFEGITMYGARTKPQGNSPGLDLLAASPPGPRGVWALLNGAIIQRFCFPRALRDDGYKNLVRAEGFPGPNRIRRVVSQEGCDNSTVAPMAQRCWADAGQYVDVALDGIDLDDNYDVQTPTNYVVRVLNVTFMCARVLTDACIAEYSPVGCLIYSIGQRQLPSVSGGATAVMAAPPPPEATGGGGSALMPALVGALGGEGAAGLGSRKCRRVSALRPEIGAALLAAAAGAAVYGVGVHRRRRSRQSFAAKPAASTPSVGSRCGHAFSGVGLYGKAQAALLGGGSLTCAPLASSRPLDASEPASLQLQLARSASHAAAAPLSAALSTMAAEALVTPLTRPRADLHLGPECGNELALLPEVLGKGTYGRVVVGTYRGERVAVKLLGATSELAPDQVRFLRSFAQEVEVLGRCNHPNVVRLLAACLDPPRPCLVMELMECSLERLLYGETGQLLPLHKVLSIAIDIASGLAFLHPTIVHRDLKPANVLISNAGSDRPVVKLADFGLSRLRSTAGITNNPEVGSVRGHCSLPVSPRGFTGLSAFLACCPAETFDPKNHVVTHRTDMYALGIIVAEMLAGEPPWRGASMMGMAVSVTLHNQRPWQLGQLPEGRRPAKLCRLVEACWEHDARRRPGAAEAVKVMMGAVLGFEGITLSGARAKPQGNSPGLDLLATSPPGPRGLWASRNGIIINRTWGTGFCFPRALRDDTYKNLVRAEGFPGPNRIRRVVSQEGCDNSTVAPLAQRCWADAGQFVDVALEGMDLDDNYNVQTPTNYAVRVLNVTFMCARVLTDACVAEYSPGGCMIYSLGQQQLPFAPGSAAAVMAAPPPPEATGGGGSALVPALVGALGAAAPLSAALSTMAAEALVTPLTRPRTDLHLGPECGNELALLPEVLGKGTYGRVVVRFLRSFAQEVEVLGRCNHPNVVRLLAACLAPPRPCLVMELMECSLERLLYGVTGQLLPLHKVLSIAIDIASGLAFLHPTIVHRDLKPANVLISNAGSDRPVVKLADFGLSRLRSTAGITKNPEVGSDMYALGIIVAEMLVGEPPWRGASMMGMAVSVTLHNQRPWQLGQLPEGRRPAKLCRLIEACWEYDARRRPGAAEAVKMMMVLMEELGERPISEAGTGIKGGGAPLGNKNAVGNDGGTATKKRMEEKMEASADR